MGVKCPRCGSNKTAKILYGYPLYTEELQKKLDSGECVLGGCCITSVEVNGRSVNMMPTRRCFACRKGFGREPILVSRGKDTVSPAGMLSNLYSSVVTAFTAIFLTSTALSL